MGPRSPGGELAIFGVGTNGDAAFHEFFCQNNSLQSLTVNGIRVIVLDGQFWRHLVDIV